TFTAPDADPKVVFSNRLLVGFKLSPVFFEALILAFRLGRKLPKAWSLSASVRSSSSSLCFTEMLLDKACSTHSFRVHCLFCAESERLKIKKMEAVAIFFIRFSIAEFVICIAVALH